MSYKSMVLLGLTLFLVTMPRQVRADRSIANAPDAQGNYFHNETPVKGQTHPPLMPGSLWRVVAVRLNCRSQPSAESAIVRTFRQGAMLQVEVYRGGSDQVLQNPVDAKGQPWMPVRGRHGADRCYVRANQRYIQPVTQPESP